MAAIRHLGFLKTGIFNCGYGSEGQFGSVCKISWPSVKSFLKSIFFDFFFDFSKWRTSAILHLLWACLDHSRRVFGGIYHSRKFSWNINRRERGQRQIIQACIRHNCSIMPDGRTHPSKMQARPRNKINSTILANNIFDKNSSSSLSGHVSVKGANKDEWVRHS